MGLAQAAFEPPAGGVADKYVSTLAELTDGWMPPSCGVMMEEHGHNAAIPAGGATSPTDRYSYILYTILTLPPDIPARPLMRIRSKFRLLAQRSEHARSSIFYPGPWLDGADGRLRHRSPEGVRLAMFEPLLGFAIALAIGVYLIVTLVKPEWF